MAHGRCLIEPTAAEWQGGQGTITTQLLNPRGDSMVNRRTFPVYGNCSIALATEEMRDGKWAVVVTVTQSTDTAQLNTDLPVTHERFDSEAEAEAYGVRSAKEWIDRNTPQT